MTATAKTARQHEADWDVKASQAAIDAAKSVISGDGINSRAMISSLSDIEWGWIVAAVIFGWIKAKAEQAVAEGCGYEEKIKFMAGAEPQPWEAGAVASVLGILAETPGIDWSQPVGSWTKDQITTFTWQAHKLVAQAIDRRNEGATDKIVQRLSQPAMEREISAKHGGSLMSRAELKDEVPF